MAEKPGSSIEVDLAKQRRIVIIGKTGSGKSASGNNILGSNIFASIPSSTSVTNSCQRGTADRFGRNLQIIDTPGLFDTGLTEAEVTKEIAKCVGMTAPGPHAFVLVLRIGRFTKEEQDTVQHLNKVFGEKMMDYLLVLFTGLDDLQANNKTLAEYVQSASQILNDLLKACHHRCIAFSNRASESERERDVKEFLDKIDGILKGNGGHCYTNEMFEEAEKVMKEREKQLEKENELKRRKQRDAINKAFDEKINSLNKKYEMEAAQLQNKQKQKETIRNQHLSEIKTLEQDIKDLKSAFKNLAAENDKVMKDLEAERRRKEKETEDKAREEDRETAREEVNKEETGVIGFLLKVLPQMLGALLPGIVGKVAEAAGSALTKVIFE